jgi:hypothetical protein
MPARRLGRASTSVRKFDVVGQDSVATAEFVRHIGLAGETKDPFDPSAPLDMVHMGPPLSRGPASLSVSSLGTTGLTVDEVRQIEVFIDEQILEYQAAQSRPDQQYVISPHFVEHRSWDGTLVCRRYNCAGFVIEAYGEVDVELLESAPSSLPPVALTTLTVQYPDMVRLLERPNIRERFGIPGEGPWPVVLAGYVVNALDRTEDEIRRSPYQVAIGDEFFPSRRSTATREPT